MKTLTSISLIMLSIIVVATALPAMDMRSPKLNTDPEKEIDVHSLAVSARQEGQNTKFDERGQVEENDVWITMDVDVASEIIGSKDAFTIDNAVVEGNTELLDINKSMLGEVGHFMHQKEGGFVAHDSFEEAERYGARLKAGDQSTFIAPTISNKAVAEALEKTVSKEEIKSFATKMLNAYDSRYAESKKGRESAQWIKEEWKNLASSRNDICVDAFYHWNTQQISVIATIQGSEQSKDIVVLGAHLDSISTLILQQGEDKPAPGADDDGSGVTVLSEVLRTIVRTGYKPKKTIQIMAFAAEELGLIGSGEIAKEYSDEKKTVIGMVGFDMVGYPGNPDINLSADYSNVHQSQFLGKLIERYLLGVTYGSFECGYGCSDHASWYVRGFPATLASEGKMDPNHHTEKDTYVDESSLRNFARLALVYLAEVAKGAVDGVVPTSGPTVKPQCTATHCIDSAGSDCQSFVNSWYGSMFCGSVNGEDFCRRSCNRC